MFWKNISIIRLIIGSGATDAALIGNGLGSRGEYIRTRIILPLPFSKNIPNNLKLRVANRTLTYSRWPKPHWEIQLHFLMLRSINPICFKHFL